MPGEPRATILNDAELVEVESKGTDGESDEPEQPERVRTADPLGLLG